MILYTLYTTSKCHVIIVMLCIIQVDTSERFLFPTIVQDVSSILERNFSDTGSMELVQCEVMPLPSHTKMTRKKSGNLMALPLPRLRKLMSEETPV